MYIPTVGDLIAVKGYPPTNKSRWRVMHVDHDKKFFYIQHWINPNGTRSPEPPGTMTLPNGIRYNELQNFTQGHLELKEGVGLSFEF